MNVLLELSYGKLPIFKTGIFTVTLYDSPKIDPRSKIHIRSNDQQANMEFIMDNLSSMYREVIKLEDNPITAIQLNYMEKSSCGQCGKQFTNKKGVKPHIIRMHAEKARKIYPKHCKSSQIIR